MAYLDTALAILAKYEGKSEEVFEQPLEPCERSERTPPEAVDPAPPEVVSLNRDNVTVNGPNPFANLTTCRRMPWGTCWSDPTALPVEFFGPPPDDTVTIDIEPSASFAGSRLLPLRTP